ncbi:carbohydrate kinase family protein [Arthrobacter sp. NPDC090010]|uniref:carbohydrate kinase family protein n=1 Tax=Arthrobacter sp. NPDC090010 TaxID=3363942 RepID=UPI0038200CF5
MLGVIGDLVEDVVVWLGENIQHGTDSKVEIFHTRGGSAANVAVFAAPLYPTRFLGCVGDDHSGRFLVDSLAASGVDVFVQRGGRTGTVVILIDESGERTMFPQRAASTLLQDVPEAWLEELELLHIPAYSFSAGPLADTATTVARAMKERGAAVSIDASSTGMLREYGVEAFMELLSDIAPDFLIANEGEAALLELSERGLPGRHLSRLPTTTVIAKAGPRPTSIHEPGKPVRTVPVPPVDRIRDLTGAGDAFAAGFLTGFLASRDLEEACQRGHTTAAQVLSSPGASSAGSVSSDG